MHACIATTGGSKSAHNIYTHIYTYTYIYTHIRTYTHIYTQAHIGLKRIDMIVISIRTLVG
jgi:hypothetical protein